MGILRGTAAVSTKSVAPPGELVLSLSEQERGRCDRRRLQRRVIRSVNAGVLEVTYETGHTSDGTIHPAELCAVAARGTSFSHDTVAEVLRLRYVELMQREEIRVRLAGMDVPISAGSVSNLSRRGLAYLEALHERAAAALGEHYRQKAFILHLDGTREGGHWCHFTLREGVTGNVLLAARIRSEHWKDIAALLRRCQDLFGRPDAIVSDMSDPIAKAVRKVFGGVPHRLCHFHFLKAAGSSLMKESHNAAGCAVKAIRRDLSKVRRQCVALRREGHTAAKWIISLVDRVTEGPGDATGEGFPFELPHVQFLKRCDETAAEIRPFFAAPHHEKPVRKALVGLNTVLNRHTAPGVVQRGSARLMKLNGMFQRMRDILQPANDNIKAPLNWGLLEDAPPPEDIGGKLAELRDKAQRMCARKTLCAGDKKAWRTIRRMMESYADRLDPIIEVRGSAIMLPRTNNICEIGFRDFKRRQRRTTGNGNLARQLDELPAQAFYAENLDDPEYCRTVFAGKAMHECFAEVDPERVRKAVEAMKSPASVGAVDKKLISNPEFYKIVRQGLAPVETKKATA